MKLETWCITRSKSYSSGIHWLLPVLCCNINTEVSEVQGDPLFLFSAFRGLQLSLKCLSVKLKLPSAEEKSELNASPFPFSRLMSPGARTAMSEPSVPSEVTFISGGYITAQSFPGISYHLCDWKQGLSQRRGQQPWHREAPSTADIRLGLCHRSDKPGLCMEGPALLKVVDSWGGINSERVQGTALLEAQRGSHAANVTV